MASDPAIRQQVIDALEARKTSGPDDDLPKSQHVRADTMEQLRAELGLKCPLGKLRRAISSLHYQHGRVRLSRPFLGEGLGRGWCVSAR